MNFDLVIKNGTVFSDSSVCRSDVGILDGKISLIGSNLSAKKTIDARGLLVIPGGVDVHTHPEMNSDGEMTSDTWEDFTRAAAFGGTTTIMDFIEPRNSSQSMIDAFTERSQYVKNQANIDYGFHMTYLGNCKKIKAELKRLVNRGLTSFKVYTTYDGFLLKDEDLLELLCFSKQTGTLVMVHAENRMPFWVMPSNPLRRIIIST